MPDFPSALHPTWNLHRSETPRQDIALRTHLSMCVQLRERHTLAHFKPVVRAISWYGWPISTDWLSRHCKARACSYLACKMARLWMRGFKASSGNSIWRNICPLVSCTAGWTMLLSEFEHHILCGNVDLNSYYYADVATNTRLMLIILRFETLSKVIMIMHHQSLSDSQSFSKFRCILCLSLCELV
jgi:hypothetical protein